DLALQRAELLELFVREVGGLNPHVDLSPPARSAGHLFARVPSPRLLRSSFLRVKERSEMHRLHRSDVRGLRWPDLLRSGRRNVREIRLEEISDENLHRRRRRPESEEAARVLRRERHLHSAPGR